MSKYQKQPPEVFYKKGVLKNFVKFTRQSLFFNNVAGLRPVKLLKKEILTQAFSCEFCEIFKNTIFTAHFRETASEILSFSKFLEAYSGLFQTSVMKILVEIVKSHYTKN